MDWGTPWWNWWNRSRLLVSWFQTDSYILSEQFESQHLVIDKSRAARIHPKSKNEPSEGNCIHPELKIHCFAREEGFKRYNRHILRRKWMVNDKPVPNWDLWCPGYQMDKWRLSPFGLGWPARVPNPCLFCGHWRLALTVQAHRSCWTRNQIDISFPQQEHDSCRTVWWQDISLQQLNNNRNSLPPALTQNRFESKICQDCVCVSGGRNQTPRWVPYSMLLSIRLPLKYSGPIRISKLRESR